MATRPREIRPRLRDRKPQPLEVIDAPEAAASAPSEPEPSKPATSDEPTRVSFFIASNGEPLWDRMHAGTREKVQKLRGGGGPGGTSAAALNPIVSAALSKAAVSTVPVALQILLRFLGFSVDSVSAVKLSDAQRAELAPLYAAALADYNVALGKHENLIVALGMTFLALAPAMEKLERAKKANGAAGAPVIRIAEEPTPEDVRTKAAEGSLN